MSCRSHYVLDRGRVYAARPFSQTEIADNRSHDRLALEIGELTGSEHGSFGTPAASHERDETEQHRTLWDRLCHGLWQLR